MKTIFQTSAGGIVYKKEDGKILWLITQHSMHKGWVFPKGLVGDKKEEVLEEAALREVEEEGGVKTKIVHARPVKVVYKYIYKNQAIEKTVYYFLMEYISGDPKDHDWEMMDAKFVHIDEVRSTLTFQNDKDAFEKALKLFEIDK